MMITATRTLLCCLIIIVTCSSQYHSTYSFIPPSSSLSSSSVSQRRLPHFTRYHHDIRSLIKNYVSSSCDTTAAGPSSSKSLSSSNSRSQYWINDEILKADEIIELLGIVEDSSTTTEEQQQQQQQPAVTTIHRNKSGKAIAVEVTSAITMNNVKSIRALSNGIQEGISSTSTSSLDKKKLSQHFKHRGFGEGQGGNDCTYLAPFLQVFCPNVVTSVKDIATLAWKAASWDDDIDSKDEHPDPMSLGIRTSEYLSYKGWPSLEAHKDIGSIYTIMISIKDPNEYEGGEFFIHNSMIESTNVKLDMLSAIVFKSNTIHGVRPIIAGHRESFVTELWSNNDSPIGICRPTEKQWESFLLDTTTAS